jgi:hypothetical protein
MKNSFYIALVLVLAVAVYVYTQFPKWQKGQRISVSIDKSKLTPAHQKQLGLI